MEKTSSLLSTLERFSFAPDSEAQFAKDIDILEGIVPVNNKDSDWAPHKIRARRAGFALATKTANITESFFDQGIPFA